MRILDNNNSMSFSAKMMLNDRSLLKNTNLINQKTYLDTMFKENYLVRKLDDFTINATKNLLKSIFVKNPNGNNKKITQLSYKLIFMLRVLADRIFLISNKKSINKLDKEFSKMEINSTEYINELAKMGNSLNEKYVLINSEDCVIEKIASNDEASLFVLNHPNYHKDKFVYAIISSLLSKCYASRNAQATCPRPKILVSKNMLRIIHEKIVNIYTKIGLTPVDATLDSSKKDKLTNAYTIKKLLNEFVENKSNIFIFPEGNNSLRVDKSLSERVQPGVSDIIKKATEIKPRVRVIPIGIDYSKASKNNLGSIHIGKPMYFYKSNDSITVQEEISKCYIKKINHINSISEIQELICAKLEDVVKLAKRVKA